MKIEHVTKLSGLERTSLWLVALGALLVAGAYLVQGPLGGLSGRPVGGMGLRRDRIAFSFGLAGAMLVVVGSGIAVVNSLPSWGIIAGSVAAVGVVAWLSSAWALRRGRRKALADARQVRSDNPMYAAAQWDVRRHERFSGWRECLAHPFTTEAEVNRRAAELFKEARPSV